VCTLLPIVESEATRPNIYCFSSEDPISEKWYRIISAEAMFSYAL